MSRLQMRTKTDSFPRNLSAARCRNLSRVYFFAHPADADKYRNALADEIYRNHDCAFCFDAQPGAPCDEDMLADLQTMHLFILPITTRLLTDPAGRQVVEQVLAIAKQRKIPVLPLMQEDGLEFLYQKTETLKNLQFLNKYTKDPTELSYESKLQIFLDSILLDQSRIQEIRDAFPARIFLSYRKKDRALAQNLRRVIHSRNVLRDVAIWYDEFLTPGEDFNQSIQFALEDSHLFMLAVTQHLLESGNYVIQHEYPAALQLSKMVLPVEVAETDREMFSHTFLVAAEKDAQKKEIMQNKINELVHPFTDASHLQETVQACLETSLGHALTENNDPHHLYQMGMAYLHGIDVEIDRDQARELLLASAKKNDVWAMTALSEMFQVDALSCGEDKEAADRCRKRSKYWAEAVMDYYEDLYNAGDRRKDLIKCRLYAKNAVAAKLIATKEAGYAAHAWAYLDDIFQAEKHEYPSQDDPGFFSQVYYHAAYAALLLDDTDCLSKSREDTVKDCMDQAIRLAALQYQDDPEAQSKLLLKRYVAAGELFARTANSTGAAEYFSAACELYPNPNKIFDREILGQLAHAYFRRYTLRLKSKGNPDLLQAKKFLQKIPDKEKTAGDWHLLSKVLMQEAQVKYRIYCLPVKNQGTRNQTNREIQNLILASIRAAERCTELDGFSPVSQEDLCQTLRESMILYRHLGNEEALQARCAQLRKLVPALQNSTGKRYLLKKMADDFAALAQSQCTTLSGKLLPQDADLLLTQGLNDCQTAEDLLENYKARGGTVSLMDRAGVEYIRARLYKAAKRYEEALPLLESACKILEAMESRPPEETSLLKDIQKDMRDTQKHLQH